MGCLQFFLRLDRDGARQQATSRARLASRCAALGAETTSARIHQGNFLRMGPEGQTGCAAGKPPFGTHFSVSWPPAVYFNK